MNERLRMEYLEAMGISMFVPRRILPGAQESTQAAVPQLASVERSEETPPPSAAVVATDQAPPVAPRHVQSAVSGIMDTFTRPHAEKQKPSIAPPTAESTAVVEPPVQFALSIWRPSSALMILDSRYAGGALPTQALLENILRAKGISLAANKPDVLIWPPAGTVPTTGWTAAREMLHAFLQARLERQPAQYLWLMGESACHAVLEDRVFSESLGAAVNVDSLASLAVVLPSLADMLQQPGLKAHTWAAIRAHHVR